MSDTAGYPAARCGEYVSGGLTSYPCWLPQGHAGPHSAVEVQASVNQRRIWEEEQQKAAKVLPPPAAPKMYASEAGFATIPWLNPGDVVDGSARERDILDRLAKEGFEALPESVRSTLRGSSALVSLGVLWHLAQVEFERGAPSVVVSKEFLERVVPPTLKSYFSALSRQER